MAETSNRTQKVERFVPETPRQFSLQRIDKAEAPVVIGDGRCQIGSVDGCSLRIADDPRVSRFHCEVVVEKGQALVKDLDSSNGTFVDGLQVREAYLKDGSMIRLGPEATVRFRLLEERSELQLSRSPAFGTLIGDSVAMRICFAQLEKMAASTKPVLIEGETGTGKTVTAEAIHASANRPDAPFVSLDCGALSEADLETSLFGKVEPRRISAFEEAQGGTLVLEEVGELSPALQLRLLPVLEKGELRRQGSTAVVPVKCRILCTTRGDLRTRVNDGRFKIELYYRLAVLRVQLPPLRERPEDIPQLVDYHLRASALKDEEAAPLKEPMFIERLQAASWPGNVRELFNHLERSAVMQSALAPNQSQKRVSVSVTDARKTYAEARRGALERFEEGYVLGVLRLHNGNVSEAARHAGIDRAYLHRLIKRHGI
ncbi:MAG: sigma 54-interacting transcriptional regulator [Myxococcaceae bacterium]|nr:sigma 54-interacting transcriptional regulator [Myxococcaceae bacterium]